MQWDAQPGRHDAGAVAPYFGGYGTARRRRPGPGLAQDRLSCARPHNAPYPARQPSFTEACVRVFWSGTCARVLILIHSIRALALVWSGSCPPPAAPAQARASGGCPGQGVKLPVPPCQRPAVRHRRKLSCTGLPCSRTIFAYCQTVNYSWPRPTCRACIYSLRMRSYRYQSQARNALQRQCTDATSKPIP